MPKPACLIVCSGKDCRQSKGFSDLLELAAGTKGALEAPCQGLCHGPIVAVKQADQVRWYSHVRSKSMRALVVDALGGGKVDKELARREVRKRRDVVRGSGRLQRIGAKRLRSVA